ncbi:phage holin family protein [Sphingomonas cavernae]|uniref:phage holin family protein n=1 Tax=Sphingomonas cavernae TaxID=2320861 RepID=UPI0016000417|nr:phage holin family protein [Sphingomonas cavernae]
MSDPRADREEDSIGDLLGQLVDDTETFVKAEIKLYRAQAIHQLSGYRKYFIFAAIGVVLGFCAIILLLMAAVFMLAPFIGAAGAALLIAVLAIAITALLFSIIAEKIRKDVDEFGARR